MLNWDLVKNPLNWIIIIIMLLLAGLAGHYVITLFNQYHSGPPAAQNS